MSNANKLKQIWLVSVPGRAEPFEGYVMYDSKNMVGIKEENSCPQYYDPHLVTFIERVEHES